jgi:hypothetical protein
MTKSDSYLDWELNLKKGKNRKKKGSDREMIEGLGLKRSEFNRFMKQWKRKHLKSLP